MWLSLKAIYSLFKNPEAYNYVLILINTCLLQLNGQKNLK